MNPDLHKTLSEKRWKMREAKRLKCHYQFKNRSHGSDKMVMMLAGYKDYLYPEVFGRFRKYLMSELDVCIITSGKFVPEIDKMCEENGWSYLSTKENHVSLVQNVALSLHPSAKLIFKLDEDIFLCEGFFENMLRAYEHAKKGQYEAGVIAPLLPVNGYGHVRVLEKLGLSEKYEELFGEKPVHAAGPEHIIENDPRVARFFWGEGGFVPSIDEMNRKFSAEPLEERACPVRFSIGAILFERSLWENMHYFEVNMRYPVGMDEESMCAYCINASRPILVSENVVVGHFSFGPQNAAMKEYFEANRAIFADPAL